jgi:hypothetical protein
MAVPQAQGGTPAPGRVAPELIENLLEVLGRLRLHVSTSKAVMVATATMNPTARC